MSDGLLSAVNGRTYIVGRDVITITERMSRHFTSHWQMWSECVDHWQARDCFFPKPEPNK